MKLRARLLLLSLALAALPLAQAAPAQYALDPVHTRVLFAIDHAGFSKALGTVSGSEGSLRFDPDDWPSARLEVSVPLTRLDLGDAKWNQAVLARNLLDGERFPQARFVSTRVEPIDAQHAKVFGTLTLHGVSQDIVLDVTLNQLKRHPLPPFHRTAGFSATTTISRAAFGIDAWKSVIGDEVQLRIEAEAVRQGKADDDTATPPPSPDTTATPAKEDTP
ncbi:YceI family protein [Stenotrophomonas sp. HITSZ_GD]|uniref:YceI family protein n=1 Tax=Stenotrophomonas sp. HITSZ_GD TaxID=3037248 RepID=UPI00240DD81E|nr:YceI family protein [Stenotrophomonas sp. HITSZ_GD]MDG2525459.1 YceI family protein [Stenotrophomonas sp. HITSZ_GD]